MGMTIWTAPTARGYEGCEEIEVRPAVEVRVRREVSGHPLDATSRGQLVQVEIRRARGAVLTVETRVQLVDAGRWVRVEDLALSREGLRRTLARADAGTIDGLMLTVDGPV